MKGKKIMAEDKLQRELSNRHIQLIAIGGAIGTGLFLGSGESVHLATVYFIDLCYCRFCIIYVYESNGRNPLIEFRIQIIWGYCPSLY